MAKKFSDSRSDELESYMEVEPSEAFWGMELKTYVVDVPGEHGIAIVRAESEEAATFLANDYVRKHFALPKYDNVLVADGLPRGVIACYFE